MYCIEEIKLARLFEQLNALPQYVCYKLIQNIGKVEMKGMIKKTPALGLNCDIKHEGNYVKGGYMKLEGTSRDADRSNMEFNNGSISL